MKQGNEEDMLLKPKLSKQIPNVLENEHPSPQLEGKKLSKKPGKKLNTVSPRIGRTSVQKKSCPI